MKNLIWIFCGLMLMSTACDCGQDCGGIPLVPLDTYFLENSTDFDMTMYWYGVTIRGEVFDRFFPVASKEEITLFTVGGDSKNDGSLLSPPFQHDSVRLEFSNGNEITYLITVCASLNNPLCEKNHEFITFVDGAKGFMVKEWRFTIK